MTELQRAQPFVNNFERETGLIALNFSQAKSGQAVRVVDALKADLHWWDNYVDECRRHLVRAIHAAEEP